MKKLNWQIVLGLILVALSAILYFGHFKLFHDAHHIWIFLVGDIAFVPIEVLLVTLIIHRVLSAREKRSLLNKMNMVIGTFFSEVGTELIRRFTAFDDQAEKISELLHPSADWTAKNFAQVHSQVAKRTWDVQYNRGDLQALSDYLLGKRDFLLALLDNPNLLEHDSFTDLLWAVFHLSEELAFRPSLKKIQKTDGEHLEGDIRRAYSLLVSEWVDYMKHLKSDYPYLFSLAIRTNPFNPKATAVVS